MLKHNTSTLRPSTITEPARYGHNSWQSLSKASKWSPCLMTIIPAFTLSSFKQSMECLRGDRSPGRPGTEPGPHCNYLPNSQVARLGFPGTLPLSEEPVLCFHPAAPPPACLRPVSCPAGALQVLGPHPPPQPTSWLGPLLLWKAGEPPFRLSTWRPCGTVPAAGPILGPVTIQLYCTIQGGRRVDWLALLPRAESFLPLIAFLLSPLLPFPRQ